jgi:hypothetical protein
MPARHDSPVAVWLLLVLLAGLGGWIAGETFPDTHTARADNPSPCPLPYHVPKYPGTASLRFAMVHDVVTERYPKHGPAYYEERNRLTRLALQEEEKRIGGAPSRKHFELIDDLAAGLDHLGRHAESIALMRDKLKRQLELGQQDMELYSTYANLGTFIILWEIHEGLANKDKARAGLEEGVQLIHKAIAINPRSHFGREIWQAVILEYLLIMLDRPEIVLELDMVGNLLNVSGRSGRAWSLGHMRKRSLMAWGAQCQEARDYLLKPAADQREENLAEFRKSITFLVPGFSDDVKISHRNQVPFDEPTLGIIGMWRLGGGPNPFFAVALGEVMIRVGQNYNAWNAFERAYLLGDAVGPESISVKFKEHCRARQAVIEEKLPEEERRQLRPSFNIHLQKGLAYQKAYQEYEARRIKEGDSLDDPHFYDAFDAEHGSIASAVGDEDRFFPEDFTDEKFSMGMMLLGAGIAAFLGVLLVRFRDWWRRKI